MLWIVRSNAKPKRKSDHVTIPRRTALNTNSAVLCRSIFSIIRQRWVSTVCKLRLRRLATSLLLLPSARNLLMGSGANDGDFLACPRWRIMEKMDPHSTAELVLSAVRRGMVT